MHEVMLKKKELEKQIQDLIILFVRDTDVSDIDLNLCICKETYNLEKKPSITNIEVMVSLHI
jgi:hypothetical protein